MRNTRKYRGNGFIDFFSMKRTKKKIHHKLNCGPIVDGKNANGGTCYTKKILKKIKTAYNQSYPDKIHTSNPSAILDELKTRLNDECVSENCWLKLLPSSQRIFLEQRVFRPFHPKEWNDNPKEWLSNFDILEVLKQYEQSDPEFEFLGPCPMDFDKKMNDQKCVCSEICKFQLSNYIKKGTKKIGMVFNLDDHDESGSHWVSLYVDIPHKLIFYFDSALNDTPPEIEVLAQRILEQANNIQQTYTYKKNKIQHQFSNTECGMYALFFLITLITEKWGGNGKHITVPQCLQKMYNHRIPDKVVEKFRNYYFNRPVI